MLLNSWTARYENFPQAQKRYYQALSRSHYELKKWCLFHCARLKLLYCTLGLTPEFARDLAKMMVKTHKQRRLIWGEVRGKSLTTPKYTVQ